MYLVLYIVVGLLAIILLLALIAPKTYEVNRSVMINKPVSDVFEYIKYIKNQNEWSPWKKKDPNMKQEFVGTDGEVGFISKWEGNKDVGTGEQEIIGVEHNQQLTSELRFFKPWKSVSKAYIKVTEIETNQTNVTWGFTGNNPIPMNIFMLFFNFEKSVGKDFEEGLESLKQILES
ncbi:SRPBCC family protein [Hwangdonia lutea]|uniref:SRPBCC family protein n=1 Tax=Hwangdonia lutea TaxID=3075823 RepID=A0AA97EPT4_9FLAO|nr:SRPBCC family protein [Hwangdonia sp. SCSIO 19198]WOD44254.1 SRPBCC family protein [Hwangdonia sp. SCSIO 19198]